MLVLLGILTATPVAAVATIAVCLRNAPEGYEDEGGFHVLKRREAGSAVIRNRQRSDHHAIGMVTDARARH
jgi:hypothetical protein